MLTRIQISDTASILGAQILSSVSDFDAIKLLENVLSNLDIVDYVFATTHYDECSNGFFFRRS